MKESNISQRLQELMEMYNLKQADVVKKTGLDKSTISYYLSGKREPAQDNIFTIANAFDVNPAWVMGYDVPMQNTNARHTQNIIRELREELHISQAELAEMLDVSPSTVSMWETGKRFPVRESINVLANILNADIDYIYGRTNVRRSTIFDKNGNKYFPLSDIEIELIERFRHADERELLLFKYILHD